MTRAPDEVLPGGRRFADRPKRLARRAERDRFAFIIMPVIWLLFVTGVVALGAVGLHFFMTGEVDRLVWGLAGIPLVVALALGSVRLLRGHFSGALNEP
jgi:hypothetical protein